MAKILLVEDDAQIGSMVAEWLRKERHTVETTASSRDAVVLLEAFTYDLVVLDWQLPDLSRIELLESYRNNGGQAKVVMLTSINQFENNELNTDCGADDFVTKPFQCSELSARIRTLLRRPSSMVGSFLKCGLVEIDTATGKAFCSGQELVLLAEEYLLLELMMRHPNQIFNTNALLQHISKSDTDTTELAVRSSVSRLRKKLMKLKAKVIIVSVYGLGYRLEEDESE